MDCIFCKILKGEIPSKKVYEDDFVYAFYDIEPVAPVHVLVIPKVHIASLDDVEQADMEVLGRLQLSIREIAKICNLSGGYRLVSNCGADGMQSVAHLHYHLIGGEKLGWPPFSK